MLVANSYWKPKVHREKRKSGEHRHCYSTWITKRAARLGQLQGLFQKCDRKQNIFTCMAQIYDLTWQVAGDVFSSLVAPNQLSGSRASHCTSLGLTFLICRNEDPVSSTSKGASDQHLLNATCLAL